MTWLDPVRAALDAAPRRIPMFFRDDDAGWCHDRLLALLDVFAARTLPVDVAVIPAALDRALAAELAKRPVGLHQHGFAHVNHEPDGRKCEFGPGRSVFDQRRDIELGRARLNVLLGRRVDPIFTPPWNRCTAVTGRCLRELGFRVLSREARATRLDVSGLRELPICIDFVRLAPAELGHCLARELRKGGPSGVMFHHAEMDAAALRRADDLLALLSEHEHAAARWMMDLV
jgi:hypothetical protein